MANSAENIITESPTSPTSFSGGTLTETDEKAGSDHGKPSDVSIPSVSIDLESQDEKPRPGLLKRLSAGLPVQVPPHWKPGFINDNRDTRSLQDFPEGFPRFAAWMNCDENFLLTRRYGWLHTRVMLFRQSELRDLELKLQRSDKQDLDDEDDALIDHQLFGSGEAGEERKMLIQQIDDKLKEYDDIVMRAKAMASLPKASLRNYASVCNHIYNKAPFTEREKKVFMNDSDFVALIEQEETKSFDGFIEDILSMLPCRGLTRFVFSNAQQRATSNDKELFLYDKKRIDTFIRIVMTLLAVALLLAPVVVLFREQDSGTVKIVVILVFTLFFSLALSLATRARRAEVFAATAA
ncbi:hypothetical protein CB0940_08593 [Lecanosticta acicola]|uniref:DUF6594 domain-containing protein n=1 Tax=Lecanosticta acicola TaxID=111012 RepID=A0AAI8Z857_9PEZI|nr:hypothetical protein CB0940_08593 [Lecanosticta acicola]